MNARIVFSDRSKWFLLNGKKNASPLFSGRLFQDYHPRPFSVCAGHPFENFRERIASTVLGIGIRIQDAHRSRFRVETGDEGIVHVGFRGSFFSYGIFDPDVVSGFQIVGEEFWKPLRESLVRDVCARAEANAFVFEERVERSGAFDRADSLVVIQRRQESEGVFEPILDLRVHFYSEALSKDFLVVDLSGMPVERHLQARHGAVVGFLVEEGVGHRSRFRGLPACYRSTRNLQPSPFFISGFSMGE